MRQSHPGRRALLAGAALLPFAAPGARAALPDRPIRLVLGFPPGSGPDVVGRLLAEALRESWPAGVVVDNKPGAAGAIAAQEVARAAPDGTTLLFGEVGQLAMAPSTYARLPYDPARDFSAVAEVAAIDFAFVLPASLPVADLDSYVTWGKARPQVFMGTFGAGTPGHFGAAMLAAEAGLRAEAVHFRATGDAMTAILGGDVQGMFGTIALVAPHVQAGRLKALAVTGPARAPLLPQVPTMAELGRPSLGFHAWFGLVAPAATPAPVLASLEEGVLRVLAAPPLRARLAETGFRPAGNGRVDFARMMQAETARWAEVVRATGFRAIE
ncbi:Bug family tripartite tricarboxylate transporter substrate binding protein [Falsiroseomonas tokyonensis]|uniref:Bug family tripartite tricarboxylate transporter substrate binding protein n=1 Tax=Falsiroseomonas tokyonensis TaxID=430521 RepID=A0ABV7BLL3_9PROT|nr:tripartite tricarboxylate transporter substrate binding protein [Falsiroseomonas tokyonensis]MBU8536466.1 tripartite tricarboxylate transporter substrate binding protein [Falsiroseomonas tokyonensis]